MTGLPGCCLAGRNYGDKCMYDTATRGTNTVSSIESDYERSNADLESQEY
jgi:hypothetical protein